jgi:hypothetical protein
MYVGEGGVNGTDILKVSKFPREEIDKGDVQDQS